MDNSKEFYDLLSRKIGYKGTYDEFKNNVLDKLSQEDLEAISGGVSNFKKTVAGLLSAVSIIGGIGVTNSASAMNTNDTLYNSLNNFPRKRLTGVKDILDKRASFDKVFVGYSPANEIGLSGKDCFRLCITYTGNPSKITAINFPKDTLSPREQELFTAMSSYCASKNKDDQKSYKKEIDEISPNLIEKYKLTTGGSKAFDKNKKVTEIQEYVFEGGGYDDLLYYMIHDKSILGLTHTLSAYKDYIVKKNIFPTSDPHVTEVYAGLNQNVRYTFSLEGPSTQGLCKLSVKESSYESKPNDHGKHKIDVLVTSESRPTIELNTRSLSQDELNLLKQIFPKLKF